MSYILHIETATEICSIAIAKAGDFLIGKSIKEPFKHAEQTTIMVQQCLHEANLVMEELAAVAVSIGPGSYTGLRIGLSVAKGICYALDKPLITINTLESLAFASHSADPSLAGFYIPMIDARRMEVYTAVYEKEHCLQEAYAEVIDSNSFATYLAQERPLVFSGNGAEKCRPFFPQKNAIFMDIKCSANHLIPLAWKAFQEEAFADLAYCSPTYIKAPNITKPKNILR